MNVVANTLNHNPTEPLNTAAGPPGLRGIPIMDPEEWRQQRASHVFRVAESIRWFIRAHQAELLNDGALLLLGRRHLIHVELFEDAVVRIGQRLARPRGA